MKISTFIMGLLFIAVLMKSNATFADCESYLGVKKNNSLGVGSISLATARVSEGSIECRETNKGVQKLVCRFGKWVADSHKGACDLEEANKDENKDSSDDINSLVKQQQSMLDAQMNDLSDADASRLNQAINSANQTLDNKRSQINQQNFNSIAQSIVSNINQAENSSDGGGATGGDDQKCEGIANNAMSSCNSTNDTSMCATFTMAARCMRKAESNLRQNGCKSSAAQAESLAIQSENNAKSVCAR